MSRHSVISRLIAVLVILSIAAFSAASLVTLHYHILPGGFVIAHSHPLPDDNHRNNHEHSRQQYAVLDAASQILDTVVLVPVPELPAERLYCGRVEVDPVSISYAAPAWHVFRRGPPSVTFS